MRLRCCEVTIGFSMHTTHAIRKFGRIRPELFHSIARLFFSCGDPARVRILLLLAKRGEVCVTDLAEELELGMATVSHHLRILRECRCVKTIKSGRMVCYQFVPNVFTKFLITLTKSGKLP